MTFTEAEAYAMRRSTERVSTQSTPQVVMIAPRFVGGFYVTPWPVRVDASVAAVYSNGVLVYPPKPR